MAECGDGGLREPHRPPDARRRLAEMIAAAHMVQAKRKPTRPSRAAKAQRVHKKRQRSAVKQGRGKVTFD